MFLLNCTPTVVLDVTSGDRRNDAVVATLAVYARTWARYENAVPSRSNGFWFGGFKKVSPWFVTSYPAVPRTVKKLHGRKLTFRPPVNRSMRCPAWIASACCGVRNPYPLLTVLSVPPSSPLGRIPKLLLSFCGSARSLETYEVVIAISINRLTWLRRFARRLVFLRSFDWKMPFSRWKSPDT